MKSDIRFVFVVFSVTAVLMFTVYLRHARKQFFFHIRTQIAEQNRLKQQLGNKQLRLENIINPASLSQQLNE